MTTISNNLKPFEYTNANVPFYPPGGRWGLIGKPIQKKQLPLTPEESMKHMVHPVGFELKLFVADEQLGGKPMCMNWDERGRLWVAVTVDYPNEMKPAGTGRDRILICEDTNGDGRADKITVFADMLSIPTSFVFYRGGVIVQQAPVTLFLKDTNGDDVADVRQVLFTGWGTIDTHAGPSNLHWGPDNWLWGIVGYSGFSGTVGGERHRFGQGFYRFKPDGSKMEFLRSTSNNSWGVGISEEGLLFGSTANGNPSMFVAVPNRYYEAVRGWSSTVLGSIASDAKFYPITSKVRQVDWHGQFTAGAGHALYTARTYPKEYWNRTAFVSEPTGHLTATFVLQLNGADFTSRNSWNLLASDDEWMGPVSAEVGPDGNVWIIDWYNYIVQHNPTPAGFKTGKGGAYETDLRDKTHGRVYRLVYKNAKPAKSLSLQDASSEKLVETLKNDNMFWRMHAQRLLVERGKVDVVPALVSLVSDPSVDEIGLNVGAIHALWTLHGLGALDSSHAEATAAVVKALRHPSAGVRRNATVTLPRNTESAAALLTSGALGDADGQVRLAALLALSEMPANVHAAEAIVRMLSRPENIEDHWLPDAATSAAAAHDLPFLKAVLTGKTILPTRTLGIITRVAEHYGRGGPTTTVSSLASVLTDSEPKLAEAVLAGLAKGWPKGRRAELSDETEKAIDRLFGRLSLAGKGTLLRLASALGSKALDQHGNEIVGSLFAIVADEKRSDADRVAASRELVEFRPDDPSVAGKLLEVISPRTPPELAAGIIGSLSTSESVDIGSALVGRFNTWTPSARKAALRVLLSRPQWTRTLLDGLDKGEVPLAELALDQKQSLATHPDITISRRARSLLSRGGSLPNPDRQKVLEQMLPLTKRLGNVALGKEVFKSQCAKCHMHGNEGERIGPDLTGMAVHPKDHLLADIIDPSRNVEGNYRVYAVETKMGQILTGLLASETKTSIELIDTEAKRHVVLREDIEHVTASPKSLMPDGFEKQVSPDDVVNLLEFLTHHGKYLPLPLSKTATAVSTRGMFYSEANEGERLVFPNWSPKVFEGVPFQLVDPQGLRTPNVVLLHSPQGKIPPHMPKSVSLPCNVPAAAIHLLSGVSGWGYPYGPKGTISMIVRLHYAGGKTEDQPLRNGEHFADYIRRVDVPDSRFAFDLAGRQVRYLAIRPKEKEKIESIEFVKGPDDTAPIIVAVTIETAE